MKQRTKIIIVTALMYLSLNATAQTNLPKDALSISNGVDRIPVDGVVRLSRKWFGQKEVCINDKRKSPVQTRIHAVLIAEFQPQGPARYFPGEGRCMSGGTLNVIREINPAINFVIIQVKEGDPATPASNILHNLRIELTD